MARSRTLIISLIVLALAIASPAAAGTTLDVKTARGSDVAELVPHGATPSSPAGGEPAARGIATAPDGAARAVANRRPPRVGTLARRDRIAAAPSTATKTRKAERRLTAESIAICVSICARTYYYPTYILYGPVSEHYNYGFIIRTYNVFDYSWNWLAYYDCYYFWSFPSEVLKGCWFNYS